MNLSILDIQSNGFTFSAIYNKINNTFILQNVYLQLIVNHNHQFWRTNQGRPWLEQTHQVNHPCEGDGGGSESDRICLGWAFLANPNWRPVSLFNTRPVHTICTYQTITEYFSDWLCLSVHFTNFRRNEDRGAPGDQTGNQFVFYLKSRQQKKANTSRKTRDSAFIRAVWKSATKNKDNSKYLYIYIHIHIYI